MFLSAAANVFTIAATGAPTLASTPAGVSLDIGGF